MTKFAFSSAIAALALAMPGLAWAQKTPDPVLVIVDTNRVANDCNACRSAATTLQGILTSANQRAQQLTQPLEAEALAINQQVAAIQKQPPGPARTTAETQIQARATAFQTRRTNSDQELQRLDQNYQSTRANITAQIRERMTPIISIVMKAHGANLAVDKALTLDVAPALDVTNEVLAQLNTALPTISVTPLPQQQPAATTPRPPSGR